MVLSEEKTTITHVNDGFDFLGFHIFRNTKARDKQLVGVFARPTEKNIKRVGLKLKHMTRRSTLNDDYQYKLQAINAVVRGWANYYRAVNAKRTFSKLDHYVWLRLSKWLQNKHRIGPMQVRAQYQHRRSTPHGGRTDYGIVDENTGKWVWRYLATQTKLVRYRPIYKKNWPNPYLERVKIELFELPNLNAQWTGFNRANKALSSRRVVLARAQGHCERCNAATQLAVHHKNRVGRSKLDNADNRPEMLEALCLRCHQAEHRAENIGRKKRGKRMPEQSSQE